MSRARAVRSLMSSEYFDRFCENQKSSAGMAKLFAGADGAENALRHFGAAIRQVEYEKSAQKSTLPPELQAGMEGPAINGM